MAWRWRIRHKLMLGLALVAGIMALLLTGTLKGLLSYSNTMKSIDSKMAEQFQAERLKSAITALSTYDTKTGPEDEEDRLREKMQEAYAALDDYRKQLLYTLDRQRDPDQGRTEKLFCDALVEDFQKLDAGVTKAREETARQQATIPLVHQPEVERAIQNLLAAADQLRTVIYDTIQRRIHEAKDNYRSSLIFVITTTVLDLFLLAGLMRFFYGWIFYPIRDLEQGVGRVAQGDFDHRIEVQSGDEMEDLAAAFNDMTSRLREMYRDLAHQVNERSRQLVRSERLASVGFLAAGVAHEINNPLASIAFCSEALESRLADVLSRSSGDNEVITKYLKMIQEEAFRCKAITQRLLEFSRSGEKRREPTDLAELVQSVLDMVQHLQNYKDRQIDFDPQRPVFAWINAQEIKSVVLNLVVNALESMDENGVLTITLRQKDRKAEMVFADSGCGMTSEILENIFEPFFTRSRTGKGTGLGLSISHRIITQHGGEIEATSPGPNQGSTFIVRLPEQPAESVKEEALGHAAA